MIDDDQEAGDATLRFLELTWREVEPEEGVYAWEDISRKYGLASLREQGIHLVLRFVCDVPGKDTHLDIPDWLYAQELLCGWRKLIHRSNHLTIGIVDPMTGHDAVRFAMKAVQKNGRMVLL